MIRELKTLIAVTREGTFAAAGQKVGLTQAAVSAQMKRLEEDLGFLLFDRTGRSARLNRMGRQTVERAQELVRLYGALGARTSESEASVPVALGAIASAQQSLLPGALARFHRLQPRSRTRVVPGLSIQLLDLVDAGELDLAVIIRPPFSLHSDLQATTLSREPFRLIAPRSVAGDDYTELLANLPFIRYDRSSFGGRQVDRFLRSTHRKVREILELDELDAIVKLVAEGLGVALVPQTTSRRRWPAAVRSIDLGRQTFHRDIVLVHRATISAAAQELAGMVRHAYERQAVVS